MTTLLLDFFLVSLQLELPKRIYLQFLEQTMTVRTWECRLVIGSLYDFYVHFNVEPKREKGNGIAFYSSPKLLVLSAAPKWNLAD